MSPRNTGTSGATTETGARGPAPLRDPTKASTTAAVAQDTAGTDAEA